MTAYRDCLRVLRWLPLALAFAAAPDARAGLQLTALELPGQSQPSITADRRGGYLLTAIERNEGSAQLFFHRLDQAGLVLESGLIASGSDWFVNWADFPSLTVADNGDWLSFVLRKSDISSPYAYDIWTTRSIDRGATWTPLAKLNDDSLPTEHGFVSLLPDGDDRVLAVWLDGRRGAQGAGAGHDEHAGAHTSLRSAVLRRDGAPIEVAELDSLTCDCCTTDALRLPAGPLVAYRNRSEAEVRDIGTVEREDKSWSAAQIPVADQWHMPGCPVNGPALAGLGVQALMVWPTQAKGEFEVRAALRGAESWRALPSLEIAPDLQGRVDAASWTDGHALVSWLGVNASGDQRQPVLRVAELNQQGEVLTRVDVRPIPSGRNTGMPRMASVDGSAILVWTEPSESGPRVRGSLITVAAGNH